MLTSFFSDQRPDWALPCFHNAQYVIISDSQFRDLRQNDIHRFMVSNAEISKFSTKLNIDHIIWSIRFFYKLHFDQYIEMNTRL